jgi:hypothetical protein
VRLAHIHARKPFMRDMHHVHVKVV